MENRDRINSKYKKYHPCIDIRQGDMEARRSMDKDKEALKLKQKLHLSENIKSLSGIYLKHSYRIREKKKTLKNREN